MRKKSTIFNAIIISLLFFMMLPTYTFAESKEYHQNMWMNGRSFQVTLEITNNTEIIEGFNSHEDLVVTCIGEHGETSESTNRLAIHSGHAYRALNPR